ncbi:MAG: hypothetical protein U0166_22185 [Acidobacteriota bacterium]
MMSHALLARRLQVPAFLCLLVGPLARAEEMVSAGAEVSAPVTPYVFGGDLRDLPSAKPWVVGDSIDASPMRSYPRPGEAVPAPQAPRVDPLLPAQRMADAARTFSIPIASFVGLGFTGRNVPDTVGDVGRSHVIEAVNANVQPNRDAIFKVWDKAGNPLTGSILLSSLGPFGDGIGDPFVVYDRQADRWVLAEMAAAGGVCVFVSRTSDPVSGGWFAYHLPPAGFTDYPKFVVWPDAYYVTTNESTPAVYALDRSRMLAGLPATSQRLAVPRLPNYNIQTLTPAHWSSVTAPPSGSAAFFARHHDDEAAPPSTPQDSIELWAFHVDWNVPANSTLVQLPSVTISEFDSDLCGINPTMCIPQPGGPMLAPLPYLIMNHLMYRSFGTYETILGDFTVDVGDFPDHAGIRWFELRKSGSAPWTLFQEGTYAPDASHRWLGSPAMDQFGNIALSYCVSDATSVFPSIRYTGRLATDPPGTMTQAETSIVAGTIPSPVPGAWGDYASLTVDPDDCTFWSVNQYVDPAVGKWGTWIAGFKLAPCAGSGATGADFVLGEGLGQPNGNAVRVYQSTGVATPTVFQAYGANGYGTNVASGDISGGGIWEIVTGPGPGPVYGPQVRSFRPDGTSISKVNFYAYSTLRYGVNAASGKLDADAFAEIITGAGPGDVFGPHVRGWNYDNASINPIAKVSYFAYATLAYGANVEEGDVDADGFAEIVTGPGPGPSFGSQIRGWNVDGGAVTAIAKINFNAFALPGYGVNVAGGRVDGDPFAEIAATPGPGPTHPSRFMGFDYDGSSIAALPGFDIIPYATLYGGRIGLGDLSLDGTADLLCGPGRDPAATASVRAYAYSGNMLIARAGTPFTPFSGRHGVNVAGGTLGL